MYRTVMDASSSCQRNLVKNLLNLMSVGTSLLNLSFNSSALSYVAIDSALHNVAGQKIKLFPGASFFTYTFSTLSNSRIVNCMNQSICTMSNTTCLLCSEQPTWTKIDKIAAYVCTTRRSYSA